MDKFIGKIPASLVNKVNEKQPMYTAVIRGKIEERYLYQDPPDEGGVKIIATRRHPSIIEKPVEQQLSLVDSVKSQRSSESPTVSQSAVIHDERDVVSYEVFDS